MNKKGFTLIELLAVILILGIIALIAIPTVSSVVEQSRKGAAESSANQFVTSVEEFIMTEELSGNKIVDGTYTSDEFIASGLNIKGTLPDSGVIEIKAGEVVSCDFIYGNYSIKYDGKEYTTINKNDLVFTLTGDNDSNSEVSTGDKICLDKECFYVISLDGNNITMLTEWNLNVGSDAKISGYNELDDDVETTFNHDLNSYVYKEAQYTYLTNTGLKIKQDSSKKGYLVENNSISLNGVVPYNIVDYDESKANWQYIAYWTDNSRRLLSSYGTRYPVYVYNNNSYLYEFVESYVGNLKKTLSSNDITGRLINADDLIKLGCNQRTYTCKNSSYKWVYQTSYWTGVAYDENDLVVLFSDGDLSYDYHHYTTKYGLRPVIIIDKNLVK